jgi:hypothetical protein
MQDSPAYAYPGMVGATQAALNCRVEGFPQTYLGLPLSAEKLRLAAFNPLIAKVDKYLSGWRALLLSIGGRLVLLNAVLDALPTFAMGALELPPEPLPWEPLSSLQVCLPPSTGARHPLDRH